MCKYVQMGGDPGISAFPEEDNIFLWKGTICGSKDTVFEGTEYKLSLSFPNDYPFKSPKVKFETCCFHPNVDVYGNICLDILQDKWSSAYDVRTILLSIQSLLGGNFCNRSLLISDLKQDTDVFANVLFRTEYKFTTQHTSCHSLEQSTRYAQISLNSQILLKSFP